MRVRESRKEPLRIHEVKRRDSGQGNNRLTRVEGGAGGREKKSLVLIKHG